MQTRNIFCSLRIEMLLFAANEYAGTSRRIHWWSGVRGLTRRMLGVAWFEIGRICTPMVCIFRINQTCNRTKRSRFELFLTNPSRSTS